MDKMTAKQKRFCDEYLIDLNATQAAIRTGYSEKTAKEQGSRLLTKANVKEYIAERMAEKEKALIADQDEVLKYLTSVLRGEGHEEMVVVEGCGDGVSRATTVTRDVCPKDRLKAAELLGKAHMLFTDKVQQDVDLDLCITVDYGDDDGDGDDG